MNFFFKNLDNVVATLLICYIILKTYMDTLLNIYCGITLFIHVHMHGLDLLDGPLMYDVNGEIRLKWKPE